MKLGDLKSVLTFAAFRSEPDDRNAAWNRRFSKQRTLLLNVSRGHTSWKILSKSGKITDGGSQDGDFKEIITSMAPEWKAQIDDGWCCVSMNTRYILSLETNVSRKPGAEEVIRTNPRAVLGARYEKGKRYAYTNNPESGSTILLTVDEDQIKQFESLLTSSGFKIGRLCCGTYAMMRRLLETAHSIKEKETNLAKIEQKSSYLDIVCCDGSICAMLEGGEVWTELRSRSDLYKDGDYQPAMDVLSPLIARLDEESQMRFVADNDSSPILDALRSQFPQADITDYSQPDHLWRVLMDS